jgi:23S rRNA pseudouridine955/2504/2580 synthase
MTSTAKKAPVRLVTVDADSAARRLDNFLLGELKGLPRTRVYRLIRKGEVRVNKGRSKPAYRLVEGDVVRIPPVHGLAEGAPQHAPGRHKVDWVLDHVLFEDEVLLVLDKPSGLAVHGGSGITLGAIELLRAVRPDCRYLELVHRLDRETSGILLIAKKHSALRDLHAQLREGTVRKIYTALLLGVWAGDQRRVNLALVVEHRRNGERHVRTGTEGKPSESIFTPLERYPEATLCDVQILTGRTHQIRVHAAAIRHPVAGDQRYGDGQGSPAGLHRLFLHARELTFVHPSTGEQLTLAAPLPAPLEQVTQRLRES